MEIPALESLHPSIIRCPIPVGDLPDRSGYLDMLGVTQALHDRFAATVGQAPAGSVLPPGPRRFVALCWGAGDEAELDDGQVSGTAGHWGPFLSFLQRDGWPWIVEHGLDLGSGDGPPAQHRLVCDRVTGAGWAMPWRLAALLVRTQDPDRLRQAIADAMDHRPDGEQARPSR